jgi:H+-translocating diphosphatase
VEADIENALKLQLIVTTLLMVPVTYFVADRFLPATFTISGVSGVVTATPVDAFICVVSGTVGGLVIGLITEYYTSHSYAPVREVAMSCKTGELPTHICLLALVYQLSLKCELWCACR